MSIDDDDFEACPHPSKEHVVRIGCHEDLTSDECRALPMLSQWVCGRPECKARAMAQTFALTRREPVLTRKAVAAKIETVEVGS